MTANKVVVDTENKIFTLNGIPLNCSDIKIDVKSINEVVITLHNCDISLNVKAKPVYYDPSIKSN